MRAEEAKIAVFGAGAMGTVLGAFLTKGGLKNVHLITRNTAHVAGLKEKGAVIKTADGGELRVPVQALLPSEMQTYDVIFLMTKQRHNGEIVEELLPHLSEEGLICTLQNGLPEEKISQILGKERTYGGAVSFGATFIGEGEVALTSALSGMSVEFGGYQNDGKYAPLLKDILAFAGRVSKNPDFVKITDDLAGARWSKLTINSAFSGLSVVTGLTFGEIAKRRKTRKIALGILRECMDVANALGVKLAPMQGHDMEKLLGGRGLVKGFVAYMVLPFAMKKHKKLLSGMLKDVQAGRKCEIDYVDGVVCDFGRKAGVATPLCDKVVELTHGIENGLYEIDYRNADFFAA